MAHDPDPPPHPPSPEGSPQLHPCPRPPPSPLPPPRWPTALLPPSWPGPPPVPPLRRTPPLRHLPSARSRRGPRWPVNSPAQCGMQPTTNSHNFPSFFPVISNSASPELFFFRIAWGDVSSVYLNSVQYDPLANNTTQSPLFKLFKAQRIFGTAPGQKSIPQTYTLAFEWGV